MHTYFFECSLSVALFPLLLAASIHRPPALVALPPCQIESLRNAVRSRAAASKVGAIEPLPAATPGTGALAGGGAGVLVVGGVAPKTLFSQRMFASAAAAEVQGALLVIVVSAAAVIVVVAVVVIVV